MIALDIYVQPEQNRGLSHFPPVELVNWDHTIQGALSPKAEDDASFHRILDRLLLDY
jgi:hypothetical protein